MKLRGLAPVLAWLTLSASVHAQDIHFLIPGSAGGGWDLTARTVGRVLVDAGLIDSARFENMAGGGGGRAIAHLIELDQPNMLMVNSTPIVVRSLQRMFPQSFRDLQPVASVIGDYSVLAVRAKSAVTDIVALAADQADAPQTVAIAGGSVRGSTDHIVAAMIFRGFGAQPRSVKYIPYDTGGKAMVGLLSGEVAALSSGYGEVIDLVEQGWVRILCVAAPRRLAVAPDVPTCIERGAQQAVFVNWRGFFAAPSTPTEYILKVQHALARMYATAAWKQVRQRYGWVDLFHPGPDFVALLEAQELTLQALLGELGMLPGS